MSSNSRSTIMVFSPRSKTRTGQGLPVSHLSQSVLANQVTNLLNKVESLHQEIENRDKILELAKSHCKKRAIPMLSKEVAILQQASGRAKPSESWLFMSDTNSGFKAGAPTDIEIRHDELDDEEQEADERDAHDDHDELEEQELQSDDAESEHEDEE